MDLKTLFLGSKLKVALTAFGLDTLYELTRSRPGALVEHVRTRYENWTPTLLVQVLRVLRTASSLSADSSLDWIIGRCEHESPPVRAAAIRALADGGWRAELRSRVPVEALTSDPSPAVRTATYRTLGAWRAPKRASGSLSPPERSGTRDAG